MMRAKGLSCHRVMASLTFQELKQLHDIVNAIATNKSVDAPPTVSEAIRWALTELHVALVREGMIESIPQAPTVANGE